MKSSITKEWVKGIVKGLIGLDDMPLTCRTTGKIISETHNGETVYYMRKFAIKVLEEKNEVILQCNGGSMAPLINPRESIFIRRVLPEQLRVGDACFCRIKGALQVHLISAIDKDRYQISNNKKFVNGWIGANSIYGLAVKVEDRILVSDEELEKRKLI
jgi:hypothetical protein